MRWTCVRQLLILVVSSSSTLSALPAAANEVPTFEQVLRQTDHLLASEAVSPLEIENAVAWLQLAAPAPGEARPADLLERLETQLEPLSSRAVALEPQRRRELLRRARETVHLLMRKLDLGVAESSRSAFSSATPANDSCSAAIPISSGVLDGSTVGATNDGSASCGNSATAPDVWFSYTAPEDGLVVWDTLMIVNESVFDTTLSLHSACPDAGGNYELTCSDDARGTLKSLVSREVVAGDTLFVRVSGASGATGHFRLTTDLGGGIAGRVTKAGTGEPIGNADVVLLNTFGFFEDLVDVEPDGSYLFGGLDDGDWFLFTQALGFVSEVWNDRACVAACDIEAGADPVTVSTGLTQGIDFSLEPGGSISGTVVDAEGGGPASFSTVLAYDESGALAATTTIGSIFFANYHISGLPAGQYTLRTSSFGYADELYDDIPCEPSCDVTVGAPVTVASGSPTEGINFVLTQLGSISGTVTRSRDGTPISLVQVQVLSSSGDFLRSSHTGLDGTYDIAGLPPGEHFVRTVSNEFLDKLFDDVPCEGGCDLSSGAPVVVDLAATTSGVDFALDELGRIEGRVVTAVTGIPLDGHVHVYSQSGDFLSARPLDSGRYQLGGLAPGHYFVRSNVFVSFPYEDQLYDGFGCEPFCDVTLGTAVQVVNDTTTGGIDFALVRCSLNSSLDLAALIVSATESYEACRTIRAGSGVTVASSGSLVLRAGRSIAFGNGFSVAAGGRLEVVIDPQVGSD